MTYDEIKEKIRQGQLIDCEKEEYSNIRIHIQNVACFYIDNNDAFRAQIALAEVKRLDKKFNYSML